MTEFAEYLAKCGLSSCEVEKATRLATRAAIAALREPSEAMVQIGDRIAAGLSSGRATEPYEDDAANIWQAMIDASLSTEGNEG
jgi:hypothetical protein